MCIRRGFIILIMLHQTALQCAMPLSSTSSCVPLTQATRPPFERPKGFRTVIRDANQAIRRIGEGIRRFASVQRKQGGQKWEESQVLPPTLSATWRSYPDCSCGGHEVSAAPSVQPAAVTTLLAVPRAAATVATAPAAAAANSEAARRYGGGPQLNGFRAHEC